jgi:cbb3-type cytochrome oxidase maturation protein
MIYIMPGSCRWSFSSPSRKNTFEAHYNQPMSVLFLLSGASLLIAIGFLCAFIKAARSGQFEDDYTPSVRMLFENETPDEQNPQPEKKS